MEIGAGTGGWRTMYVGESKKGPKGEGVDT